jgi:hypothetical protein
MAEIELNVITGQCLNRQIDNIEIVRKEARAWQESRNNKNAKVDKLIKSQVPRAKKKDPPILNLARRSNPE